MASVALFIHIIDHMAHCLWQPEMLMYISLAQMLLS